MASLCSLHLLLVLSIRASAPELSLADAVANARAHHPSVRQADARIDEAVAAADIARGPLLPQINGQLTYTRSTANYAQKPGAIPRGEQQQDASQNTSDNFFGASVNGSQIITDFGESWNAWQSAKINAVSQRATATDTVALVVLAVRKAFFDARSKRALRDVAQDTLDNQVKHRTQVENYVAVGKRPEIDLVQARADYASARLKLITAQNDYDVAKATLNQAMGLEGETPWEVADDTMPEQPGEDKTTDLLLAEALQNRYDYIAADVLVQSKELAVDSAHSAYAPQLSAQASFTDQGQEFDGLAWNWSVGLQLQVPIFQGYVLQANSDQAAYNLVDATAGRDLVRQQVRLDVESARLGVRGAKEELIAANETLANATQLLSLAEGRYEAGVGSIIELGDAQVAHTTAAGQQVKAEFDLATARATFLRALGR